LQLTLDRRDDRTELTVVHSYDDCASCVFAPSFRPAARQDREILDIEGDEDAIFPGSQLQKLLVAIAVEISLFIGGTNIVTSLA
jgi:hypothetical protein